MSYDPAFDDAAFEAGLQASTDAQRAKYAPPPEFVPGPVPHAPAAPVAQQAPQPLPEAPCSVTARVDFYGAKDILLTFRGHDGRSTLEQLARALDWIRSIDAPPMPATYAQPGPAPTYAPPAPTYAGHPNGGGMPQAATGLVCPTHRTALKPSKNRPGEFYCTAKISPDNGAGKPVYCQYKVQG